MFYEFIKTNEFEFENYTRYNLTNVKVGVNYILVVTSNAGPGHIILETQSNLHP